MNDPAMLCLGDIHLDHTIWRTKRHIRGDAFVGYDSFIDTAIELQVPVILCGDIFDTVAPDTVLMQYFRHSVQKLKRGGCDVYAYQGNHDKRPGVPIYQALSDDVIHIGDGVPVTINGVRVRAFDYATRDTIEVALRKIPGETVAADVLFLHQAVRHAVPWDGAWNCDLDWVDPRIPLIIMGDIHHGTLEWDLGGGRRAYYTGPSHMRNISERGPKSAVLIHKDLSVARIPLKSRVVETFEVKEPADLDKIRAWLKTQNHDPLPALAWAVHTDEMAGPTEALVLATDPSTGIVVAEEAKDQSRLVPGGITMEHGVDLINFDAVLSSVIDPKLEPDTYSFIRSLFKDPAEIGDLIRAERSRHLS